MPERWSFEVEWQRRWADTGQNSAVRRAGRPKWFVVELPPFANGTIHLGHVRNYTMGDVIARFRRMAGFDVLYTTGFDSFGLPNETAAREAGIAPSELVDRNIARMRDQFQRLGYSHDASRILSDHEPRYYHWVQWVFLALYRQGLVYRHRGPVNWCATCGSTLADGLVEDGKCWRCSKPVEVVQMDRWFIAEADLAEALTGAAEPNGWPSKILSIHRDWVGRREGYEVTFDVNGTPPRLDAPPLTLFIADLSALERAVAVGVAGSNAYLAHLNLGAMSRPTSRGPPLATSYELISPIDGRRLPLLIVADADCDHAGSVLFSDVRPGPSPAPPTLIASERVHRAHRLRLRDWDIARPRAWGTPVPIVHCDKCGAVPVPDHDLPVLLPDISATGHANPLEHLPDFLQTHCPACGDPAQRDTDTLEAYSSPWWYYLICASPGSLNPFIDPGAEAWMPVDVMIGGADQTRTCFFHLRTMTVALNRMGIIRESDPVRSLLVTGMVKQDGRKMSKSGGNSVDPTSLIDAYGADALRIAMLWAAAPDQDFNWHDDLVKKASSLLRRLRTFVSSRSVAFDKQPAGDIVENKRTRQVRTWIRAAEQRASDCLGRNSFHLAIDQIAKLLERLSALAVESGADTTCERVLNEGARSLLVLIAPLAPHLAEELWQAAGGSGFVTAAPWPVPIPVRNGAPRTI